MFWKIRSLKVANNSKLRRSNHFDAVWDAENSFLEWKLTDEVFLQALPRRGRVSGADKGQSRVPASVLEDHVITARMTLQQLRAIVDKIMDHDPTTVGSVMPRNFVQVDQP